MLKRIKRYWNNITEGLLGYLIYALLGIVIAFGINYVLGNILNTSMPLVVVVSSSMSHSPNSYICGTYIQNYKNTFESYWLACNRTYEKFNITKAEFLNFPFKNGLEIGDVIIVKKSKEYKIGDIIVYQPENSKYSIIHRIVAINEDGTYQTKGDRNNAQFPYEKKIEATQIHGKAIFRIPLIGLPRAIINWVFGI